MEIRDATEDDAEELEALEIELFRENCFNSATIARELEYGFGLVAVDKQRGIIGYLLAAMDGNLVDVLRLGVVPEFRRRGLARQMLNMALGARPQAMLTVRRENRAAIKLYIDFGFYIAGELASTAWVMKRLT